MALPSVVRQLAGLAGASSLAGVSPVAAAAGALACGPARAFATAFGRKDVVYNLANASDPEAEAAIRAFQREQFAAAAKGAPGAGVPQEPEFELASQIERKYAAAQVVESGIQVRCVCACVAV
jgi:hypothetical protein